MRQAPLFCCPRNRERGLAIELSLKSSPLIYKRRGLPTMPPRQGLHTLIRTNLEKNTLEKRAERTARRLQRAKSRAQYVARSLSYVERTIVLAPLTFSHEVSAAMRQSTGVRFALRLCRRFVLFYLPYFGMASMVLVVATANVFASAKTGEATFLRTAYADTIQESGAPQASEENDPSGNGAYAGGSNYISPNTLNVGGPIPPTTPTDSDSLQNSAVYAAPSPVASSAFSEGVSAVSSSDRGVITYTVKEGDVPSVIASSFGISLDTLLWANNLKDGDYIRPGDKLTILPISGVQYKVQRGDTLAGIAARFKGDASQIVAFNNLSSNVLPQGQNLIIPNGQMPVIERKSQSLFTPAYAEASNLKDMGGYFIAPSHGYISQGIHPHNGVDIADSCGTPVYAAAAGRVLIADGTGWNGGYGKYVLVQHPNGVETRYAHATKLAVQSGEDVEQGQLLMYMGETGRATGCHVHFEVLGARNPFAGIHKGTTL